jgi:transposase
MVLSEEDRWNIVFHARQGLSQRAIAGKVGCSRHAVQNTLQLHAETGRVVDKRRACASRKLGGAAQQLTLTRMRMVPNMSLRKMRTVLRKEMRISISFQAIGNFLHSQELAPKHRAIAVRLVPNQKQKRLDWCLRFRNKPKTWWEKVVWVDEKNFGASHKGNRHNDSVWVKKGDKVPPRFVSAYQANAKLGAVISYKGLPAVPYAFPEKWSGPAYGAMLRNYALPYIGRLYHSEQVVFFQDNDPSHLTAANKQLLNDNNILFEGEYKFPPNSGDLNPVENLWGMILEGMEDKAETLTDAASIVAAATAAWKKVDPAAIRAMAHSMPTRLEECIAKDGGRTRW